MTYLLEGQLPCGVPDVIAIAKLQWWILKSRCPQRLTATCRASPPRRGWRGESCVRRSGGGGDALEDMGVGFYFLAVISPAAWAQPMKSSWVRFP